MRLFRWFGVASLVALTGGLSTLVTVRAQAPAQAPARDTSALPSGTASIKGHVVTIDGTPLRRVQLRLAGGPFTSVNAPTVATNARGEYEFRNLPGGRYTLFAAKNGYLTLSYGQRRPLEAARPFELSNAQALEGIDFGLPKGGVIAAQVVDDLGKPVFHASVSLLQYRFSNGTRQLTRVAGGLMSETDDLGEFRVYGLAPGEYYVLARLIFPTGFGASDSVRSVGPTYYPGTASIDDAQRVTLAVAEEVRLVIPLAPVRAATVSGIVRSAGGGPPPANLQLTRASLGGESSTQMVQVARDGAFSATNVLPGDYTLGVSEQGPLTALGTPAPREFARVPITVAGQDISGLIITTSRAATLGGRFVFDTGSPPTNLRPAALAIRPQISPPISTARTSVNDDWSFGVTGAFGTSTLTLVDSAGQTAFAKGFNGWFLKAILLDGKDVTDTPLEFRADIPLGYFQIVLTQNTTTVNGTVADARGVPVREYGAVVFAEERDRWASPSRFIAAGRPDQQGRFTITGLPPGRYLAAAVDYLEVGEEADPDLLARLAEHAVHVTLGESETKSVSVVFATR